ncbi:protein kinase domain-containing protein [Trichothermofontia sp.]
MVKQLKGVTDNPKVLELARRLFRTEADALERLGQHPQIPQLLAFFEEGHEFYIVQELVQGCSLASELLIEQRLFPSQVVRMLADLLPVLAFIHSQGVIHRDLKPSNILRRHADQRLVIIDFGIAKKLSTQIADLDPQTKFTIPVRTPGYTPSEQSAGRPHFNSDLYALGMIAIEALTGIPPRSLEHDPATGRILWHSLVPQVPPPMVAILDRMVHPDYTQRYASAAEVLAAIADLPANLQPTASNAIADTVTPVWSQSALGAPPVAAQGVSMNSENRHAAPGETQHERQPIALSPHTAFLPHLSSETATPEDCSPAESLPEDASTLLRPQLSPLPPTPNPAPAQPNRLSPPTNREEPDADEYGEDPTTVLPENWMESGPAPQWQSSKQ